jgi:hypothetical protein
MPKSVPVTKSRSQQPLEEVKNNDGFREFSKMIGERDPMEY